AYNKDVLFYYMPIVLSMSFSSPQGNLLPQSDLTDSGSSDNQVLNRDRKRALSEVEHSTRFGRTSHDMDNIPADLRRLLCYNAELQGRNTLDALLPLAVTSRFYAQVQEVPTVEDALQTLRMRRIEEYI
ncbi:hypothetical protein BGZ47_002705, partial [Haplosporangium gracile]